MHFCQLVSHCVLLYMNGDRRGSLFQFLNMDSSSCFYSEIDYDRTQVSTIEEE